MKCLQCNQEYQAVRATSRYCSAKCRKYASRAVSVTINDSVTPVSVTKPVSVTVSVTDKPPIKSSTKLDINNCTGAEQEKFNGINGNVVKDITREEFTEYLKNNPKAYIPNWYSVGLASRNSFFPTFKRIVDKKYGGIVALEAV